jgi:hypothetical protein
MGGKLGFGLMARARNIKPGFYKNEDLAECSVWARYVFPGLWMLADREGRLEDRPKRIKGELLPFDAQDVEPLLRELATRGFITRYKNLDGSFIQIAKFKEHQSPHYSEKKSVIKPEGFRESAGDIDHAFSENPPPIKKGSQPPDCLNPDSLIPDSPNPEPLQKTKARSAFAPPEWVPVDSWKAFEQMRTKARKPMTDRARELIVKELESLQSKGFDPVAVLDQSIRNNWQDVFPLKDKGGSAGQSLSSFMAERDSKRATS